MAKIKMQIEAVSSLNVQALAMIVLAVHPDSMYKTTLKLPIKVGSGDAVMLCNQLGKQSMRPTTHTLMSRIIEEMGVNVDYVCISKVEGSLFFADITLSDDMGLKTVIDARPSDALSLAATVQCPIYCEKDVLEAAGMPDFRNIKEDTQDSISLKDIIDIDITTEDQQQFEPPQEGAFSSLDEKIDQIKKLVDLRHLLNTDGLKKEDVNAIDNFDDNFEDNNDEEDTSNKNH